MKILIASVSMLLLISFACKEVPKKINKSTGSEKVIAPETKDISTENKIEVERIENNVPNPSVKEKPTTDKKVLPAKKKTPSIQDQPKKAEKATTEKEVTNKPVKKIEERETKEEEVTTSTSADEINPVVNVEIEKPEKPVTVVQSNGSPNHKPFSVLLSSFVNSNGNVDYGGLKDKEGELDAYLADLKAMSPKSSWTRDTELAYWINVYNAFTLKLILSNYPIGSITELHGGKPWDERWIDIGGKTYSLNNIENDIIRPKFNEPRIHFAVNCAAKSCPPLANEAFTAKNLSSLLESRTKEFINNTKYNTLSKSKVTVSKIFDWYGKDFGNVATFISKYANVSPTASVEFNEYDWSLNGK